MGNDKPSEHADLMQSIEAILMVVDEPVDITELAEALAASENTVLQVLRALRAEFAGEAGTRARGFVLRETGSGWRIYSNPHQDHVVNQFVNAGRTAKLSQASLETLAVIAYRQPVTRAQIALIRGVNVDGVVRTLLARDLITETDFEAGTGATLYKTTRYFMERMGLESLDDLPLLAPALPPIEQSAEIEELVSQKTTRTVSTNSADPDTQGA